MNRTTKANKFNGVHRKNILSPFEQVQKLIKIKCSIEMCIRFKFVLCTLHIQLVKKILAYMSRQTSYPN